MLTDKFHMRVPLSNTIQFPETCKTGQKGSGNGSQWRKENIIDDLGDEDRGHKANNKQYQFHGLRFFDPIKYQTAIVSCLGESRLYENNNLVLHTIGLRALDGATEHRPGLVTLAPAIEYAGRLTLESWRLI